MRIGAVFSTGGAVLAEEPDGLADDLLRAWCTRREGTGAARGCRQARAG